MQQDFILNGVLYKYNVGQFSLVVTWYTNKTLSAYRCKSEVIGKPTQPHSSRFVWRNLWFF